MKLPIILAYIFFIALGIVANIYVFKLGTMPWIGLMLIAFIILTIIGTFVGKANKKRKGIPGEPDAFIFPDKTAKKLKKMDLGVQYEASVISSALLMLGIVLFLIYFIFFTSSSWVMKGLIIFNSVCGMGLMGGMLVTYYQQLVAYRESTKFLRQYVQTPQNRQPAQPAAFRGSMEKIRPRPVQRPQPRPQPQQYPQTQEEIDEWDMPEPQFDNYDYTDERREQM